MSLSVRASGTAVAGTTSVAVVPTAGSTDQDINFLTVVAKPYNASLATPAGWTVLASLASGSTASGADTGSTLTKVYYKLGAIGTDAVTVDSSSSANTMIGVIDTFAKADTEVFDFSATTSMADDTSGANYSATSATTIAAGVDDWIIEYTGIATDAGSITSPLLAISGATLGSFNSLVNTSTTNGDDCRLEGGYQAVTVAATAVVNFAYTNASNSNGGTVVVRLRAATPAIAVDYAADSDVNPAIEIDLTNLPTYLNYKVTRLATSGEYAEAAVRGMDDVTPGGAAESNTDYEMPLDQDLEYTLTILNGDITIATVDATPSTIKLSGQVDGGAPLEYFHLAFLKNVSQPSLNQRLALADFSRWTAPGRVLSNSNILGRKNPVIITDVTGGKKGSFSFLTWSNLDLSGFLYKDFTASMDEIELLLESGDTLLFQTTSQFTGKDIFMKIEDISVTRLNKPPTDIPVDPDMAHTPCLLWELTFTEVDRPLTSGVAFTIGTWQDVLDDPTYDDWSGANSTFATWLELLQYYS